LDLQIVNNEFRNELSNILNYWITQVYNPERRTFFGRISNEGEKFPDAPLSAVFMTRILWTFSAAYRYNQNADYKHMADEAYRILRETFWDPVNGGIYWNVQPDGTPVDTKKQFYAQAFFIYALSEYYQAFQDETAKELAVFMFNLTEKYAFDPEFGGYFEAKTADWQELADQRLSEKEPDVKKTMNTHLHILEAYTNLYRIWKTSDLERQLHHLIRIFPDKITDKKTFHLNLFFDVDWTIQSDIDSYGHDIEGSWLLCEAAEVLGNKPLMEEIEHVAVKMALVTESEGFHENGGLYYERNETETHKVFDWWPQAEAVVGFFNAWQLTGNETFLKRSLNCWHFIQNNITDKRMGEWFWGVSEDSKPLPVDKVNGWKAPYHNGRMCLEMLKRTKV
jgi:cellobiose epimerase